MSYPRLRSDGAPQTAHDIWELWTAGASHAGDSFSLSLWPTRGYWGPRGWVGLRNRRMGGWADGWFAKVDNVFLRLGGFAKVDNRFGYEKWT